MNVKTPLIVQINAIQNTRFWDLLQFSFNLTSFQKQLRDLSPSYAGTFRISEQGSHIGSFGDPVGHPQHATLQRRELYLPYRPSSLLRHTATAPTPSLVFRKPCRRHRRASARVLRSPWSPEASTEVDLIHRVLRSPDTF